VNTKNNAETAFSYRSSSLPSPPPPPPPPQEMRPINDLLWPHDVSLMVIQVFVF
jgi:hypothetical protein